MLERFQQHLHDHFDFLEGKKLLVACSGGIDSVVLTQLMLKLDLEPGLAHCNFGLRGEESDEDAEFVQDLAEKHELAVYIEQFETREYAASRKISTQMAARELRYAWFEEIRKDFGYHFVLTAHHADDELETFLINLSRGTGIRGLRGINQLHGHVARPLLPFTRAEILAYAQAEGLYWREDSSNSSDDYLRNALRNNVIPRLKEIDASFMTGFKTTQQHLKAGESLVDDYLLLVRKLVMSEAGDTIDIDIEELSKLPNKEALLYELLQSFGFTSWKDISRLLTAQSGKQVVSPTHRIVKDRSTLIISPITVDDGDNTVEISGLPFRIEEPIRLNMQRVEEMQISNENVVYVDSDLLKFPLLLRKWKEGDVFYPFGMSGKKKVSKYFKDEKLSLVAKERTWLLTSDDKIVWIVGRRLDERFKVSPETKNIAQLKFNPQ